MQGRVVDPWAISAFNPDWIFVAKDRVYRSSDRGNSWTALGTIPGGECTALGLAANDIGRMYVAKEFNLYRTTNGQDFSALDVPNGFSHITDIEVNPVNADEVWISLSNYNSGTKVLHSTDGGIHWTSLSNGLPLPCEHPRCGRGGVRRCYVGTDVGIYRPFRGSAGHACPQACPMSW